MVWYSHFFQNFPQFVVIHTVKDFSAVSEEEVYIFMKFPCFFYDPAVAPAAKSHESCPTLSDPMDCSLPGSSIHGIFRQEYWSGLSMILTI